MVSTASDNFIFVVTRWRSFQEKCLFKEQHSELIHTAVHKNIDLVEKKNRPECYGFGGNTHFSEQLRIFTAGLRFPTHFSKT